MDDLTYIVGLGFSGSDLPRAVGVAFLAAMLFSPRYPAWFLGVFALIVDRFVWPPIAQSAAGAGGAEVFASIAAAGQTFTDDLGVYLVRYIGISIMIVFFAAMRMRINDDRIGPRPA